MLKWLKSLFFKPKDQPEESIVVRYFIGFTVFYGDYHNSRVRDNFNQGWAVLDFREGIDQTEKIIAIQSKLAEAQPYPNPSVVITCIQPLQVWETQEYLKTQSAH